MDKIKVASEKLNKYNIKIVYIQIQCNNCKNKWAAYIPNGEIDSIKLVCRECAKEKVNNDLNK